MIGCIINQVETETCQHLHLKRYKQLKKQENTLNCSVQLIKVSENRSLILTFWRLRLKTAVGIFYFTVNEHKMKTSQLSVFGVSRSESKRLLSGTTTTL